MDMICVSVIVGRWCRWPRYRTVGVFETA